MNSLTFRSFSRALFTTSFRDGVSKLALRFRNCLITRSIIRANLLSVNTFWHIHGLELLAVKAVAMFLMLFVLTIVDYLAVSSQLSGLTK